MREITILECLRIRAKVFGSIFWGEKLLRNFSVFTSKVLCLRIGTPRNFSLHLLVKTINNQYLYLMSCKRTPKSILAMAPVLAKQSRRDAEPRFLLLQNFLLKLAISQYPPISPGKTNNWRTKDAFSSRKACYPTRISSDLNDPYKKIRLILSVSRLTTWVMKWKKV